MCNGYLFMFILHLIFLYIAYSYPLPIFLLYFLKNYLFIYLASLGYGTQDLQSSLCHVGSSSLTRN